MGGGTVFVGRGVLLASGVSVGCGDGVCDGNIVAVGRGVLLAFGVSVGCGDGVRDGRLVAVGRSLSAGLSVLTADGSGTAVSGAFSEEPHPVINNPITMMPSKAANHLFILAWRPILSPLRTCCKSQKIGGISRFLYDSSHHKTTTQKQIYPMSDYTDFHSTKICENSCDLWLFSAKSHECKSYYTVKLRSCCLYFKPLLPASPREVIESKKKVFATTRRRTEYLSHCWSFTML